jgi:hypothetical protein
LKTDLPGRIERIAAADSSRAKIISVAAFAILTILIFANVGIFEHISDKPNSSHTWAQCDRASVAACYYNEDMNFFKPRIYNRSNGDNEGICGMEFPIINYSAAICYKIFGFHEFYFRLINFILLFLGLIYSFKLAQLFLKDVFYSAVTVWLFMMSPVLMFYSANFLPDTGSLGLVMMSWYLFFRLGESDFTRKRYIAFIVVLTLACLIKMTCMVSLIAMAILIAGKKIRFFKSHLIPKLNVRIVAGFVISVLCVFSWYRYAAWLNDHYHNYFFILNSNPVNTTLEFWQVIGHIDEFVFKDYYPLLIKWTIAVSFILFVIAFYFQRRVLAVNFFFLLIGFAGFAVIMLRQFPYHEYYIIPLLVLIYFLFLTTSEFISRKLKTGKLSYVYVASIPALLILVNMSMIVCKKFYREERYGKGYYNSVYTMLDRYAEASPYLDSVGVKKNDLVIAYWDATPNGALYLMDRKGVNIFYGDMARLKDKMETKNFKYLVIGDTTAFSKELYDDLQKNKIGESHGVQVYSLK